MIIALTDPGRDRAAYDRYAGWLERWIPGAEIRRIGYNVRGSGIEGCSGLVLSGGGDVHPRLYGREDAIELVREINEKRDEFEFGIIERSVRDGLPTLGTCRGSQVFNVAMGGTLIPDIEREGFPSHRKTPAGDRIHGVSLAQGMLLGEILGATEGEVNSSHHQAVRDPGKGLTVSARSTDGIIEGLEWEDRGTFLVLVQWHPERMPESPFSKSLAVRFAEEVRRFSGES